VDTDSDIRLARRLRRDICERGRDKHGILEVSLSFILYRMILSELAISTFC
jgi:uridine kinase